MASSGLVFQDSSDHGGPRLARRPGPPVAAQPTPALFGRQIPKRCWNLAVSRTAGRRPDPTWGATAGRRPRPHRGADPAGIAGQIRRGFGGWRGAGGRLARGGLPEAARGPTCARDVSVTLRGMCSRADRCVCTPRGSHYRPLIIAVSRRYLLSHHGKALSFPSRLGRL
jgi:hypothetical protein